MFSACNQGKYGLNCSQDCIQLPNDNNVAGCINIKHKKNNIKTEKNNHSHKNKYIKNRNSNKNSKNKKINNNNKNDDSASCHNIDGSPTCPPGKHGSLCDQGAVATL